MTKQTEALDAQADAIINASRAPNRSIGDTMQLAVVTALTQSAARIAELEAELTKLRAHKWEHKHTDTMNEIAGLCLARDHAEAQLARAEEVIRPFSEIRINDEVGSALRWIGVDDLRAAAQWIKEREAK